MVYHYAPGRSGDRAERILEGFDGVLQVDGYAGYHRLARPERKGGAPLRLAWCWSHGRREIIAATPKGICRLTFDDSEASLHRLFPKATIVRDGGALRDFVAGTLETIEAPLAAPELPIDVAGTAFQEAVWRELRKIPPGETRSYAQIAAAIGHPKAVRAVGTANGDNHVAVLIPCHRVIRSDGSLGGYGGGLDRKKILLAAEGHAVAEPELPLAE